MRTLARPRDRAEILRRLKQLRPDSVGRWGRMSAHQMVCHLNDSCGMATGERPVSRAGRFHERTILKWLALYVPVRWPPGFPTVPEIDQHAGGTRPGEFAADVSRQEMLLTLIATRPETVDRHAHPLFGRLSHAAWLRWAYLHTDHHLRQFGV